MKRKFNLPLVHIVFGMIFLVVVHCETGFAASAWQEEWERILRAAKSEGKLTLIGPLGADRRDALSQAFQSKYGITVEYHPDAGAGIFPRINAERKAGLYLWDVLISGTSTSLEALIPNKFLDPLEPTLILPEVKESKYWRGGALEFLDPGHQTLQAVEKLDSSRKLITAFQICDKLPSNTVVGRRRDRREEKVG